MRWFAIICAVGIQLIPLAASAAIVPCSGAVSEGGLQACQACDFAKLGQNILTFLIEVFVILAAIAISWAGLLMVTAAGDTGKISSAKSIFTNVVIGLVILLSSWLIVDTVMKVFFQDSVKIGPWNEIQCKTPAGTSAAISTQGTVAVSPSTPLSQLNPTSKLSDAYARQILAAAGVNVKTTNTSLEGIKYATIQDAINLKNTCNCAITITGGTETGFNHTATHLNGDKYDVRITSALDSFIYNNYQQVGQRSDGTVLYQNPTTGSIYAREGDHWDALPQSQYYGDSAVQYSNFDTQLSNTIATDEQKSAIQKAYQTSLSSTEQNIVTQMLTCDGGGQPQITSYTSGSSFEVTCIKN